MHYARSFSEIDHQFIISTVVPKHEKERYDEFVSHFDKTLQSNVTFSPIFSESPNESFRNFLNPRILAHDLAAIFRTVSRHRPDVVIAMYVIHAYPLVLLKRLARFTLFAIVSGGDLELHDGFIWRIIRRVVYSNSRIIFTVGHKLKAEIEGEGGRRTCVIPTGTDPDYYRPVRGDMSLRKRYGYRSDDFVVLTLSFLIERKCIDDVIIAVKQLRDKCANVKMIIAGEGPDRRRLEQMSHDLGLRESVVFTGSVSDATKRDLLNIANVYVIASYQEGMPFSLMEAMSCGCVCVCSNVGDIHNLVSDSVNGFLITPRDPQLLVRRIKGIMGRPEQDLLLIKSRARQTILDRYDFRKLSKKMLNVIEKNMFQQGRTRECI
jgi:glycosyltransferase involved in cell wall biosynthesis